MVAGAAVAGAMVAGAAVGVAAVAQAVKSKLAATSSAIIRIDRAFIR
jgi:hypothetical protein